jgi:NADH:ubiquinone oxidoreductase subunit 6 (subunit J)
MSFLLAAATTFPDALAFALGSLICIAGALGVVLARNPVHSALCLVATLFGVAVLFVAQLAHFLAAVQVMVYAGAIVVLFLFVIMLLGVDKDDRSITIKTLSWQRGMAVAAGLVLLGLILGLNRVDWVLAEPIEGCVPLARAGEVVDITADPATFQPCLTDAAPLSAVAAQAPGTIADLETSAELRTSTAESLLSGLSRAFGVDGLQGGLTTSERSDYLALRDSLDNEGASPDEVRRAATFLGVEGDGIVNPRALNTDPTLGANNVKELAREVFTYHLLALQATGVLLIVAVVAAVVLAKRPDTEPVAATRGEVSA